MDASHAGGDLWRLTVEHSPVGMTLVGLDGRLLVVNRALCDMLGYPAKDLREKGFQELTHPDDLALDLEHFERALAGEIDSYRLRKRYLHAQGHVVWGDLSVALVRREGGAPLHFISQILDVTELERERGTLEAIFETVSVGLLLIDRDGRYERMNRRHASTMGLPFPEGHAGRVGQLGLVYHLADGSLLSREEMPTYRAAQGEEFDDLHYWVGEDPLTRRAFSCSARTVRDVTGERTGAVLAYQDITELVRAMKVKDEFVASVSHELRTPLTAVLGYLELLRDEPGLPAPVERGLEVVERNALRLQTLVADLLHVAQARDGAIVLAREPTDLAAVVRDSADAAAPAAARAGVAVVLDLPECLDAIVDPQRIRQVVDNLVSNGIKYTDAGGTVTVSLRLDGREVRLTVRDTGIGIAEDELPQVFTRFFRGGEALGRQIPGTGLGLDIVRSILLAHGGDVRVESEAGVGTAFTALLPA